MAKLVVGARASVKDKEAEYGPGTIRFVGVTKFQPGDWVGIELDKPSTFLALKHHLASCCSTWLAGCYARFSVRQPSHPNFLLRIKHSITCVP
jgi:hypothetical protein